MRKMLETKRTYVFNKPMIYKMVATLADFDPDYRALDEIVLDSSAMEASSIANFKDIKKEGKFFTNPAYVDALSQSAGFVMNANDKSNLELEVFVNHGWDSFQLFEDLSPQKNYETHVAMHESSGKLWQGDVFVLDGDKVVALFEGITVSQSLVKHVAKVPDFIVSFLFPYQMEQLGLTWITSCKVWHDDFSTTYCRRRVPHKLVLKVVKIHLRRSRPLLKQPFSEFKKGSLLQI